ncbi:MAG: GNAT family N-acetyltransferase [Candidatus Brachytrichaceae bacterium NZ_4S206]|jgi:N-acetylglutamate synthase-like GNAT family acetyltransferase
MVSLRPATEADQGAIRRMVLAACLDPTSLDWRNFIVAVDGAEIVGVAQIKPYADCREFGSLVVKPAYRNQGIGGRLIEALLQREQGEVYLLCASTLAPYYAKFGFTVIDDRRAPATLRRKLRVASLFRLAGVRVVVMRRAA